MTAWTEIFASKERQEALDDTGIKYSVDQDLNLGFGSYNDLNKALEVLNASLCL